MKVPKQILFFFEKIYIFVPHFKNTQDFTGLSDVGIWTISNLTKNKITVNISVFLLLYKLLNKNDINSKKRRAIDLL